jgi:hypothetical protein
MYITFKLKKLAFRYLFLFICCFIKSESSFAQIIEDFERSTSTLTNTSSTTTGTSSPVAWTSTQANTTTGFTSAAGPFSGNALTFSGTTAQIMSTVLTGSAFSFGSVTPWEWTLLYQTPATVVPSDNSNGNVTGNNWRFWFNASGTNPTAGGFQGYYVTQDGGFLKFYHYGFGSKAQCGSSIAVAANTKYIIRAVRQSDSGGTYLFYATAYTSSTSFPTIAVNSGGEFDQIGSYKNSFFQSSVTSGNDGIFAWDNLNFYQATLTLSGLNSPGLATGGNGIAAFLTQGDSQKAVFGFKATALGSVNMTQANFSWTITGGASSNNDYYFDSSNAKLYYSSADDVYTPAADDNSIGNVTLTSGAASISGLNESITNSSRSYFLVVNVNNYSSSTTATASIGLSSVTISGNSPVTIPSGIAGTSFTLPATPTTWTGATSTAWATATNWNGGVPTTSASAIIPTGLSKYPVLAADVTVSTLSLNNASIDLNGHMLNVSNSMLANNSTITTTGNASYLDITGGSGDRSISGTGLTVNNLKVNLPSAANTFTLFAPVSVTNLLTMSTGILSSGGNLTLTSTSASSANVDVIPTGASITGDVNVQRFITGGTASYRGYRLLSSPVSAAAGFYSLSYLQGSGTYLTGAAGGGFDVTSNPTIYLYRDDQVPDNSSFLTGNYRAITAINNSPAYTLSTIDGDFNLPVGNGFLFFFRGNNSTNTAAIPNNITFNMSGTLNQGQYVVKDWFNQGSSNLDYSTKSGTNTVEGFNLVGNPYPSSIDWDKANTTTSTSGIYAPNVGNSIYIYNTTTKLYSVYDNSTHIGTNGATSIIPVGQGFFVQANNTSAQLVFNESAKSTLQVTNGSGLFLSAVTTPTDRHLRLQLSKDSINKDETVIVLNAAASTAYVQSEDALYLQGSGVLSLSNMSGDNKALAISQMPLPKQSQTINLNVYAESDGLYQLNMTEVKNIPFLYDVWLMDAYKQDSLDIKNNPTYNFNVSNSDAASISPNRFSLIIRQNPARAYRLLDFAGNAVTDGAQLVWTTENEQDYTDFTLERSTDGKTFAALSDVPATGAGNYSYIDKAPVIGQNQYRLKQQDITGAITYSNVVQILYSNQSDNALISNNISVYPNPVKDVINLSVAATTDASATYTINIINSNGGLLKSFTATQPVWQNSISDLMPGVYILKVINNKDGKVIGTNKFIKL